MKCSHNVPYECKCQDCVSEALKRVLKYVQEPAPTATPAQREAFWASAFRQAHSEII